MERADREIPKERSFPTSAGAKKAYEVIQALQLRFKRGLEGLSSGESFEPIDWLRDQGRHGGGRRYARAGSPLFNRASINESVVHYEDLQEKRLRSATALSTIIHPENPHMPSMHMHISWTELRDGASYWRVMGDLNPSLPAGEYRDRFNDLFQRLGGGHYESGKEQGESYFYIPALGRHRGVSHFYLEGHRTESRSEDLRFARSFGEGVVDEYCRLFQEVLDRGEPVSAEERRRQLEYHTVYFFQVLTLDRGTTSGILVHDQNDVGILASLPARIAPALLKEWRDKVATPQEELLEGLLALLPGGDELGAVELSDDLRARLAKVVREHYKKHPEALHLQASGGRIVPTVANHLKGSD